jgi:fucose permease
MATEMGGRRSKYLIALIFSIFFAISLLTNILGPIVPDIIDTYKLSLTAAALLPFAFFIAYGVMSVPAGIIVEVYKEKRVITGAFLAAFVGALSFAVLPIFPIVMTSLFVIGAGMATLQVAINPLLRVAGGEEHFAFNSAFAQVVFGLASFLSPQLYSYLVRNLGKDSVPPSFALQWLARLVPADRPWVSLYWIFVFITLLMILLISASKFPDVQRTAEEQVGTWEAHRKLLHNPMALLYFISIFAYVGSEQGTANWMSKFLAEYHHYDPHTSGANAVSWFWGLLTGGCLAGMLLLKIFDSRKVLVAASTAALSALTVALFGPGHLSVIAFPLVGLFASVMWPISISLALNSVSECHGSFAGILCTGIVGGAITPVIIGRLGDLVGLRLGMTFLYVTFGWVLGVGFWAKPLVANETIGSTRAKGNSS